MRSYPTPSEPEPPIDLRRVAAAGASVLVSGALLMLMLVVWSTRAWFRTGIPHRPPDPLEPLLLTAAIVQTAAGVALAIILLFELRYTQLAYAAWITGLALTLVAVIREGGSLASAVPVVVVLIVGWIGYTVYALSRERSNDR